MAEEKDWLKAHRYKPPKSDYYEVRNALPIHPNALFGLKGSRVRYWDADARIWRVTRTGPQSIMGTHPTHEWREVKLRPTGSLQRGQ